MSIKGNTIAGAAGGWLGDMFKKNGLGTVENLVAGAAGRNILPIILSALGVATNSFDGGVVST